MAALRDEQIWPQVSEELRALQNAGGSAFAAPRESSASAPAAQPTNSTDQAAGAKSHRHVLVLRFALVNLCALALLGAAYHRGWLHLVVEADATGLCLTIFAVFIAGLAICGSKLIGIDRELSIDWRGAAPGASRGAQYLAEIEGRDSSSRALSATALRSQIGDSITIVRTIANSLVLLGLIGTVLGFIIALSAVDPEQAGNVQAIEPMVTRLLQGMSVALYTTLVGAVLNLWLTVNYRLLASGGIKLASELIGLGEARARYGNV